MADLARYLGALRRWAWLVALATILAGTASYVWSSSQPSIYRASTRLLVTQDTNPLIADPNTALQTAERLTRVYAELIKTRPVLESAAQTLGRGATYESLGSLITVRPNINTLLIDVSAEHSDPQFARDAVNIVAATFIRQNNAAQLARLQALRDNLGSQVDGRLADVRALSTVEIVEQAVLPTTSRAPRKLLAALFGAAMGLLVSTGIILLRAYLAKPKPSNELGELPILAVVDEFPKRSTQPLVALLERGPERNGSAQSLALDGYYEWSQGEAYRILRTRLQFMNGEARLRSVLVTSATYGEGKTTTAANLALALALSGFRTLLVDADFRQPSLHNLFRLPNDCGLTSLLQEEMRCPECLQPTIVPNLQVLPSGPIPANAAELLGSKRTSLLLARLGHLSGADYVVFDSPPVLPVADALVTAPQVDGVVLVVNSRTTKNELVLHAVDALERVGARLAGVVLNRFPAAAYYTPYRSPLAVTARNGTLNGHEVEQTTTVRDT